MCQEMLIHVPFWESHHWPWLLCWWLKSTTFNHNTTAQVDHEFSTEQNQHTLALPYIYQRQNYLMMKSCLCGGTNRDRCLSITSRWCSDVRVDIHTYSGCGLDRVWYDCKVRSGVMCGGMSESGGAAMSFEPPVNADRWPGGQRLQLHLVSAKFMGLESDAGM